MREGERREEGGGEADCSGQEAGSAGCVLAGGAVREAAATAERFCFVLRDGTFVGSGSQNKVPQTG